MSDDLEIEDIPDRIYLHIIADSTGRTASSVVCGAVMQFPEGDVTVRGLTHVKTVFHTILDGTLRREVIELLNDRGIASVDLLGPATSIVSRLLEEDPTPVTGMTLESAKQGVHLLDATYLGDL